MAGYNETASVTLDVLPGSMSGIAAVSAGMSSLVDTMDELGRAVGKDFGVMETLTVGAGAIAASGLAKAINAAGEYEYQMKMVQVVSQQSGGAMADLSDKVAQLGAEYGTAFTDISEGLQTLGRAGLNNAATQTEVLTQGLQTAKLEGADLQSTLETLIQTTALFGGDLDSPTFSQDSEYINDLMVGTSMAAPIDVSDVAQTLQYSGGMASVAGANLDDEAMLEDYMGTIAAFAQKGVTGSVAGTALRAFFNKPATQDSSVTEGLEMLQLSPDSLWEDGGEKMKPVSEQIGLIQSQMDKLNISTYEQMEIWSKIVGGKMGQQMLKLDSEDIREMTSKVKESGSTASLANQLLNTYQGKLETVQSLGETAFRSIGEHGLRYMTLILDLITPIVEAFQNPYLTGFVFVQGLRLIIAALKQVGTIISGVITGFKELNTNISSITASTNKMNAALGATNAKTKVPYNKTEATSKNKANIEQFLTKTDQVPKYAKTIIDEIMGYINKGKTSILESINGIFNDIVKKSNEGKISIIKSVDDIFSSVIENVTKNKSHIIELCESSSLEVIQLTENTSESIIISLNEAANNAILSAEKIENAFNLKINIGDTPESSISNNESIFGNDWINPNYNSELWNLANAEYNERMLEDMFKDMESSKYNPETIWNASNAEYNKRMFEDYFEEMESKSRLKNLNYNPESANMSNKDILKELGIEGDTGGDWKTTRRLGARDSITTIAAFLNANEGFDLYKYRLANGIGELQPGNASFKGNKIVMPDMYENLAYYNMRDHITELQREQISRSGVYGLGLNKLTSGENYNKDINEKIMQEVRDSGTLTSRDTLSVLSSIYSTLQSMAYTQDTTDYSKVYTGEADDAYRQYLKETEGVNTVGVQSNNSLGKLLQQQQMEAAAQKEIPSSDYRNQLSRKDIETQANILNKQVDDERKAARESASTFGKLKYQMSDLTNSISDKVSNLKNELSEGDYSYQPYTGTTVGVGDNQRQVSGVSDSFGAWRSGDMSFKGALQNSVINPLKNFGSQVKSSYSKGGLTGALKTGLSGAAKGATSALGSLTSMLGGPVMIAFMALEAVITFISNAYNEHNKKIQEAENDRADAASRVEEAENVVISDMVGDGADVSEEEKEALLDEKYGEMQDVAVTGNIESLDSNTLALYAATNAYSQANKRLGETATQGTFGQLSGDNWGLEGFGTWISNSFGAIQARLTNSEEGYFDNMSGVQTANQRDENYAFGTDDASLLTADAMQEGVAGGLSQFYGKDWESHSKTAGGRTYETGGLKNWYKSMGGADWALRQNMGILSNSNMTQGQRGALLSSMKNDTQQWKRLAKTMAQYEGKYGKGSFNKALQKDVKKMNKDEKAMLNQVKRLQSSIGAKLDYQSILAAASLVQYSEMLNTAREQIQPTLESSLQNGFNIYGATNNAYNAASSASAGAAGASANAAAIAALLGAQMQEQAYETAAKNLQAKYSEEHPGSSITMDESSAAVRSGQATEKVSAELAKTYNQEAVKAVSGMVATYKNPGASSEEIKAEADKYYNQVKDSPYGSNAQMSTLYKRIQNQVALDIDAAYQNSDDGSGSGGDSGSGSGSGNGGSGSGGGSDSGSDDSGSTKKSRVDLVLCNKKEIPKLNVNLFKKAPSFTVLNKNFKLRDIKVNTQDKPKAIVSAVKNAIIDTQKRTDPKIIQDEGGEYDPVAATDGNSTPTGTTNTSADSTTES